MTPGSMANGARSSILDIIILRELSGEVGVVVDVSL